VRRLASADYAALARRAGATTALRLSLACVLAALLAAALLAAARGDAGRSPLDEAGKTTVLAIDVSSSIRPRVYRQIGATLERAIAEGGRFGVVLFSDDAYELLPPGTPAIELEGLRRYFVPLERELAGEMRTVSVGRLRFPEAPWNATLTAGTRISTGLRLAREVLAREGVPNGKVVLVSDLEDEYRDLPALGREIVAYAAAGLPLRVVALSPSRDDRKNWERLVGSRGSVDVAAPPRGESSRPDRLPPEPFPFALVALAAALALALALNEHLLVRFRPGGGEA
jgi:hypothetical protein